MHRALHVAAAISLLGGAALADEAGQSCKTSHNLVGACFSIRGRLFVFDPAPTIRIAWDGTDRVLGVLDRQSSAAGPELVPGAVSALLAAAPSTTEIDGDYLVCPFDRTHLGRMQAVCIQAASHLIARRR